MVTFGAARDELFRRLQAVSEAFGTLYPDVQPPRVFLGFPANEPPFYIVVDEIVDIAKTSGGASMGHAQLEFTLNVWCCAQHSRQETAADTLLAYVDAVFNAVLADHTMNGTVDNSMPIVESAGTAADSSKRYIAAAALGVECQVFAMCPHALADVVLEV